jgi:iron complex transport system permease protein
LPIAAFAGAMAAILLVYGLAHATGRPTLHGLLLTGLAVSSLASAGTSVMLVATEEFRVKAVLFWLAGGLEARSWTHVQLGAVFILTGFALLAALGGRWTALARRSGGGIPRPAVHATRLAIFALASLIAGAATSVAGAVRSSVSWRLTPCVPRRPAEPSSAAGRLPRRRPARGGGGPGRAPR